MNDTSNVTSYEQNQSSCEQNQSSYEFIDIPLPRIAHISIPIITTTSLWTFRRSRPRPSRRITRRNSAKKNPQTRHLNIAHLRLRHLNTAHLRLRHLNIAHLR